MSDEETKGDVFEEALKDFDVRVARKEARLRMEIGRALDEIRETKGWTYDDLMEAMNISSRSTVQRILTADTTKSPTLRTLVKAAEALDVELGFVIEGASNTEEGVVEVESEAFGATP
jgi:transcriptional regulator with XRE-family HTH domain